MSAVFDWLRLNWMLVTVILVIVAAFVFLRSSPTAGIDSVETLDASLTTGQPVVLDFYSNF
jgi:hypothetical protein